MVGGRSSGKPLKGNTTHSSELNLFFTIKYEKWIGCFFYGDTLHILLEQQQIVTALGNFLIVTFIGLRIISHHRNACPCRHRHRPPNCALVCPSKICLLISSSTHFKCVYPAGLRCIAAQSAWSVGVGGRWLMVPWWIWNKRTNHSAPYQTNLLVHRSYTR